MTKGMPGIVKVMLALATVGVAVATFFGLRGCEASRSGFGKDGTVTARIAGRTFHLEPALDDATRNKGLGGRTEIAADGGMIFVFREPMVQEFVMRDCPIPIDIAFLDDLGRVLAMHEMQPEAPRGADERADVPQENWKYENRLKRYSSRFAARFAIELRAGTLRSLHVRPGDVVRFDYEALKAAAR